MRALFICFILFSCSGSIDPDVEKVRKRNCVGHYIQRKESVYQYTLKEPINNQRPYYDWEQEQGMPPKITKEYFRCKGSFLHPEKIDDVKNPKMIKDCDGKHSLPILGEKEDVYPVFIKILNYIQKRTRKKVILTTGHRCPTHNAYADSSKRAITSKHLIGAEVDFYVQGMEKEPEKVIDLIFEYYADQGVYKNFSRYTGNTDVLTKPWFNKEIFIKLYLREEGRDFDNRHSYPYIGLQLRFDTKKKENVVYSWEKANKGYYQY